LAKARAKILKSKVLYTGRCSLQRDTVIEPEECGRTATLSCSGIGGRAANFQRWERTADPSVPAHGGDFLWELVCPAKEPHDRRAPRAAGIAEETGYTTRRLLKFCTLFDAGFVQGVDVDFCRGGWPRGLHSRKKTRDHSASIHVETGGCDDSNGRLRDAKSDCGVAVLHALWSARPA